MSFVQRELDRISALIANESLEGPRFKELFAAQQALAWALEPGGFSSPYESITGNADSSAASEGYFQESHRPLS